MPEIGTSGSMSVIHHEPIGWIRTGLRDRDECLREGALGERIHARGRNHHGHRDTGRVVHVSLS
jgi:hypothetical protein